MTNFSNVRHALATDQVVDIITLGRKTGAAHRIEIWYHRVDGRYYICGIPGEAHNPSVRRPRDWLANLRAKPKFKLLLKESTQAELNAIARIVTDLDERRRVMTAPATDWYRQQGHDLDDLIANAPLVEVMFPDLDT